MVNRPWRIIPRPLLETVLNNHAHHHRVPQPLILHGPLGVGKTTLILDRLLGEWNQGSHLTGYFDFAESIRDHHPQFGQSFPWASWSNCPPPPLPDCAAKLESCLESMAHRGVQLGAITSQQVFSTLSKWHGLHSSLRRVIQGTSNKKNAVSDKASGSVLWDRALFALSARCDAEEIDGVLGLSDKKKRSLSMEEASYYREAVVALKLAKEVIGVQHSWRANAIAHLNRTGGFSRSLANSCTDWPCLLLELLSQAAEIDHFQPNVTDLAFRPPQLVHAALHPHGASYIQQGNALVSPCLELIRGSAPDPNLCVGRPTPVSDVKSLTSEKLSELNRVGMSELLRRSSHISPTLVILEQISHMHDIRSISDVHD